jgi:Ca2+-binding RTX toxin-like protein
VRRLALGGLFAATLAAVPGVASAGEVFLPKTPPDRDTPIIFRAFPGETNNLTISGNNVLFDSLAALTAGAGCGLQAGGSVTCEPGSRVVEADLGDRNDEAHTAGFWTGTLRVSAGPGEDTVAVDSFCCATFVYGEAGNDDIAAGGEGGQVADGGPGNDIVKAGGAAGTATGRGGPGNDLVYFRAQMRSVAILEGGNGDDTIVSQPAGGTAEGGNGDDIIAIHGRIPSVTVDGSFTIHGGDGADTIIGGVFADTIDGGDGRDYIDVLEGEADTVSCGPGRDVVRYDASDAIAADCEILLGPSS